MKEFDLKTITKGIQKTPLKILVYGSNGVGKSHFAAGFPNPIFMDIEHNIDHIDVSKQRINSWSEALSFVKWLRNVKHDFNTLVIDALDQLQVYGIASACLETGTKHINEGFGKALSSLTALFIQFRQECEALFTEKSMHLVFIAHTKTLRINDLSQGSYDMIAPSLHDRISPLFTDWCNCIGYAHRLLEIERFKDLGFDKKLITVKEQSNAQTGTRVLRVIDSPSIVAKEVFNLPTIKGNFPLSAEVLLHHIKNFYQSLANNK